MVDVTVQQVILQNILDKFGFWVFFFLIWRILLFLFFQELFEEINSDNYDRNVYTYPTCATDTDNIKLVDLAVRKKIIENIFKQIGVQWKKNGAKMNFWFGISLKNLNS